MIEYIKKDVTTVTEGVVAHGCNTKGVMGAGVALAIKNRWPAVFSLYARLCREETSEDLLGLAQIVMPDVRIFPSLYVANCFTQLTYGNGPGPYASLDAIKESLYQAFQHAQENSLPLYMPKIGCGLGGLTWEQVQGIIESLNKEFDINVFVCDI